MKKTLLLVLTLAACKSSSGGTSSAVACDPGATELATKLQAGDKAVEGKPFAFKNCAFSMQGGDTVSFAAKKGDPDIRCTMKDGEAGVKTFRRAAMALDMKKLKLDVSGTIGKDGATGCTIDAHE